ncbi:hypothetical protein CCP3SC15_3080004 [Gammaproteobacteria bacterium]
MIIRSLAYVKTLRDAGFSEPQAEAQANALANELSTKHDIERLESLLKKDMNFVRKILPSWKNASNCCNGC